ncbi:hypothetical protein PsorP6_006778 [Peronosclerospora sorghi]|uniref:Uncharacterized protein n=1 Tax=Peronosclerospora sorghi TaxID=230839 RepID=A0ACC0W4Q6_9STRA|nr:hypothetical protein PsorP6_006778 [Peronosclerospora sorghi]
MPRTCSRPSSYNLGRERNWKKRSTKQNIPIIINQVSEAASRTMWNMRNVDTSVEAQRSAENERKRRMCAQRTDLQAVRES